MRRDPETGDNTPHRSAAHPPFAANLPPPDGAEPFVGVDGLAMLLLSLLVIALSCGATLILVLRQVVRAARGAAASPSGEARWLVVLGSKLEGNHPGPAFQVRLDRTVAIALIQPAPRIVVLGGATAPGAPPEGLVGVAHLRAAGIPDARLAAETRSRHTLENLRAFRAGFLTGAADGGILLVTSRSHLARACAMAARLGLAVTPCAAESDFRLSAREAWRLLMEAFLLHWYRVGRGFATLTRNRRMLRRIS